MWRFAEKTTQEDEGSDCGVDEELRRDINSLTAVIESQQTATLEESQEAISEQHQPLEGLKQCLEFNLKLQVVLVQQLSKVATGLRKTRMKIATLARQPRSRKGFTIWKFRKGAYFKDNTKRDYPTVCDIVLPASVPNYCMLDNYWRQATNNKLYAGVRMHAVTLKSEPLLEKLRATDDKDLQRKIRKEISDLRDFPDAVLFNNLGDIDWGDIAFEVFAGHRAVNDCCIHWNNVLSPLVNTSFWTISEDKDLLSLAKQYNERNWLAITAVIGTGRSAFECLRRHKQLTSVVSLRRSIPWSAEEDRLLLEGVARHGEKNWRAVALKVGHKRTHAQCLQRWFMTVCPGIRKGRWDPGEDKNLREAVFMFGEGNWAKVASMVPTRTATQCRERWCNVLDARIRKGAWTVEEDDKLMPLCAQYSGKAIPWSKVAAELGGSRTDSMCAKRWRHLSCTVDVVQQFANRMMERVAHLTDSQHGSLGLDDDWVPDVIKMEVKQYERRLTSLRESKRPRSNREVADMITSLNTNHLPPQLSALIARATVPDLIERITAELSGSTPVLAEQAPLLKDLIPKPVLTSLLASHPKDKQRSTLFLLPDSISVSKAPVDSGTEPSGSGLCVPVTTQSLLSESGSSTPHTVTCQSISLSGGGGVSSSPLSTSVTSALPRSSVVPRTRRRAKSKLPKFAKKCRTRKSSTAVSSSRRGRAAVSSSRCGRAAVSSSRRGRPSSGKAVASPLPASTSVATSSGSLSRGAIQTSDSHEAGAIQTSGSLSRTSTMLLRHHFHPVLATPLAAVSRKSHTYKQPSVSTCSLGNTPSSISKQPYAVSSNQSTSGSIVQPSLGQVGPEVPIVSRIVTWTPCCVASTISVNITLPSQLQSSTVEVSKTSSEKLKCFPKRVQFVTVPVCSITSATELSQGGPSSHPESISHYHPPLHQSRPGYSLGYGSEYSGSESEGELVPLSGLVSTSLSPGHPINIAVSALRHLEPGDDETMDSDIASLTADEDRSSNINIMPRAFIPDTTDVVSAGSTLQQQEEATVQSSCINTPLAFIPDAFSTTDVVAASSTRQQQSDASSLISSNQRTKRISKYNEMYQFPLPVQNEIPVNATPPIGEGTTNTQASSQVPIEADLDSSLNVSSILNWFGSTSHPRSEVASTSFVNSSPHVNSVETSTQVSSQVPIEANLDSSLNVLNRFGSTSHPRSEVTSTSFVNSSPHVSSVETPAVAIATASPNVRRRDREFPHCDENAVCSVAAKPYMLCPDDEQLITVHANPEYVKPKKVYKRRIKTQRSSRVEKVVEEDDEVSEDPRVAKRRPRTMKRKRTLGSQEMKRKRTLGSQEEANVPDGSGENKVPRKKARTYKVSTRRRNKPSPKSETTEDTPSEPPLSPKTVQAEVSFASNGSEPKDSEVVYRLHNLRRNKRRSTRLTGFFSVPQPADSKSAPKRKRQRAHNSKDTDSLPTIKRKRRNLQNKTSSKPIDTADTDPTTIPSASSTVVPDGQTLTQNTQSAGPSHTRRRDLRPLLDKRGVHVVEIDHPPSPPLVEERMLRKRRSGVRVTLKGKHKAMHTSS